MNFLLICLAFFRILQLDVEVDVHGLHSGVVVQRILPQLPPDTALLEPTEWHTRIQLVHTVDPCRTRLESVRSLNRSVQVLREDGCSKTVSGVVGLSDYVVLVLEFDDNADRTKDFFLDDLHVRGSVGEDGGSDEIPFGAMAFTANLDFGTSILAGLDVTHDTVVLDLRDLGTLEGLGVEGVADLD